MVQVSTQHDYFRRLRSLEHANRVPGCARLGRRINAGIEGNTLDKTLVAGAVSITARLESKLSKLRADVFGGDAFVVRGATAALHRIAREKAELRANVLFLYRRFG